MSQLDEVITFSRDFINHPGARTPQRKAKIREVLRLITGQKIDISCGTCYVEALFKIIKFTNMAFSQYELRRGYVAVFNTPVNGVKAFTNKQITDDLAVEFLRQHPERIVYFVKMPRPAAPVVPADITIVKPPQVIRIEKPAEVNTIPIAKEPAPPKPVAQPRKRPTVKKKT